MEHATGVRPAGPGDAAAIVELYELLYQSDGRVRDPSLAPGWAAAEGAQYFGGLIAGPGSVCLLAERGGQAIAYLAGRLHPASSFRRAATAELESMAVRPAWRGQGAGSALVAAFKRWAGQHGASRLTVTAYAGNERAIAFYQRHGFAPHQITLALALAPDAPGQHAG